MNLTTRLVLESMRHGTTLSTLDIEALQGWTERKASAGWTEDEIFDLLRNTEEVNPTLDEATALKNMRAVEERVKASRVLTGEEVQTLIILFRHVPLNALAERLEYELGQEVSIPALRTLISLNSKLKGARS